MTRLYLIPWWSFPMYYVFILIYFAIQMQWWRENLSYSFEVFASSILCDFHTKKIKNDTSIKTPVGMATGGSIILKLQFLNTRNKIIVLWHISLNDIPPIIVVICSLMHSPNWDYTQNSCLSCYGKSFSLDLYQCSLQSFGWWENIRRSSWLSIEFQTDIPSTLCQRLTIRELECFWSHSFNIFWNWINGLVKECPIIQSIWSIVRTKLYCFESHLFRFSAMKSLTRVSFLVKLCFFSAVVLPQLV